MKIEKALLYDWYLKLQSNDVKSEQLLIEKLLILLQLQLEKQLCA